MAMMKSCSRCGKIHSHGHRCYSNSKNYYQHSPEIRKFRNSTAWKNKAQEIKERDKYLCQICLKRNVLNFKELSVHHIQPVAENESLRLDNNNLITLCEKHHQECESEKISRQEQQAIVDEIMKGY